MPSQLHALYFWEGQRNHITQSQKKKYSQSRSRKSSQTEVKQEVVCTNKEEPTASWTLCNSFPFVSAGSHEYIGSQIGLAKQVSVICTSKTQEKQETAMSRRHQYTAQLHNHQGQAKGNRKKNPFSNKHETANTKM